MSKENSKIVLTFGVGLLSVVVGYAMTTKIRNNNEVNNLMDIISQTGTTGSLGQDLVQVDSSSLSAGSFPLNYGDSNQLVYNLQLALNKNYNANLNITGTFDESTATFLCGNYFDTCFTWFPNSLINNYSVSQTDYTNILNYKK